MKEFTEKEYKIQLLNELLYKMLNNRLKTSDGFSRVVLTIPKGYNKTPKEVIKILQKYLIIKEYTNINTMPMHDNGKGTVDIFFIRSITQKKPFSLRKLFQLYIDTIEQIEEGKTV